MNRFDPLDELVRQHRPGRIKLEYLLRTAALELRVPVSWLWYFAWAGWLRPKRWLGRRDWIHLPDVEEALLKPPAVIEAAEATGERIPIRPEVWERLPAQLRQAFRPDDSWKVFAEPDHYLASGPLSLVQAGVPLP